MNRSAGDVFRATVLAGLLVVPAWAAGDDARNMSEAVVPPGQGDLLAEMLGRGVELPGECRFTGGGADGPIISATYACASGELALELRHPSVAPAAAPRTAQFAIVPQRGAPPAGFVDALVSRIRSREGAFRWSWLRRPSALQIVLETVLSVAAVVLPAAVALVGCVCLAMALRRRRRQPTLTHTRWTTASTAVAATRVAGLVAVVVVTLRGAVVRAAPPDINLVITFGILSLTGFLWLALSGFFGYGSARRGDWVALVAFLVALVVREVITLHSVQEIEIQFAQGAVGRHSVVYPLLQMFFAPIVRDPQAFTMHMNGVLGALACLSMYLFARQRLESRSAGFLCALFLATHPLVARFSPTDGPYSLLLAAWFSGLALLSTPTLDARGMLGGVVLLGIAATARIEGSVLLVASLLLLDPRVLVDGVRRHRVAAVSSVLVVAALGAVQMYFQLLSQIGGAGLPGLNFLLEDVIWPVAHNGRLFTTLLVIGALSGIVTRRWLGLCALIASLVVVAPIVHSVQPIALHRLVPACALQSMVAAIGAYSLTVWMPRARGWSWLATVPGALMAVWVLIQHRSDLTTPYVFNEEYELVRTHLAPGGVSAPGCTLMAFRPRLDLDVHDFAQVVPDIRVLDCGTSDCVAAASQRGCVYYVRSAACYYHPAGVPPDCRDAGATLAGDRLACLNDPSAAFERSVGLEPVEVRTVDILSTFIELDQNYPRWAEIGLFRVRPQTAAQGS